MAKKKFGEWQLCPKCGGSGKAAPGYEVVLAGNVVSSRCDLCHGGMVIGRPVLAKGYNTHLPITSFLGGIDLQFRPNEENRPEA